MSVARQPERECRDDGGSRWWQRENCRRPSVRSPGQSGAGVGSGGGGGGGGRKGRRPLSEPPWDGGGRGSLVRGASCHHGTGRARRAGHGRRRHAAPDPGEAGPRIRRRRRGLRPGPPPVAMGGGGCGGHVAPAAAAGEGGGGRVASGYRVPGPRRQPTRMRRTAIPAHSAQRPQPSPPPPTGATCLGPRRLRAPGPTASPARTARPGPALPTAARAGPRPGRRKRSRSMATWSATRRVGPSRTQLAMGCGARRARGRA
jgi:hypothetical protein